MFQSDFMNFGAPVSEWGPDGGGNTLPFVAHLLNQSASGLYIGMCLQPGLSSPASSSLVLFFFLAW